MIRRDVEKYHALKPPLPARPLHQPSASSQLRKRDKHSRLCQPGSEDKHSRLITPRREAFKLNVTTISTCQFLFISHYFLFYTFAGFEAPTWEKPLNQLNLFPLVKITTKNKPKTCQLKINDTQINKQTKHKNILPAHVRYGKASSRNTVKA